MRKRTFVRRGEVGNWLTSEAFDLSEPRSLEGEEAIRAALAILEQDNPSDRALAAADKRLRAAGLPDIDPFWVRWDYFRTQRSKTNESGDTGIASAGNSWRKRTQP